MINPKIERDISKIKSSFLKAKPFRHAVIENFLDNKKAELLLKELKKEEFFRKESDLFSFLQTNDLSGTDNKVLKEFYSFLGSKEFSLFVEKITGIKVKQGALDVAGSLYESCDYLLCHDDQLEDRRIAYILYLSKDFTEKDGARFVLFDSKDGKVSQDVKKYVPKWNSLMIFEVSKISFHEVEENMSKKDRYAIGGWLH